MNPERQEFLARTRLELILAASALILACLSIFVPSGGRSAAAQSSASSPMQIQSSGFQNGSAIPRQFTCDGAGELPVLHWSNAPAAAKSFALVMHDPDAPIDFTHWIAWNIPAGVHSLAEAASGRSAMPQGSIEGINSFGRIGYGGPCPPPGRPHRYIFQFYALDVRLNLAPGGTRDQLEAAMRRHVLAEAQIVGIYRRASQ